MRFNLNESNISRHFMTKKEERVKTELIELLKNKRHAKYAARLALFDLNIVPLSVDSHFAAAISFDEGTIFISEGFLNGDRAVFEQLDVVLRHELAHNLLMHQVRMMHELGEEQYIHVKFSDSLHRLWNILEDDEISNTRYTAQDKVLVRNLLINGETISGLVTEDHRSGWENMTLEQMYQTVKEDDAVTINNWSDPKNAARVFSDDIILSHLAQSKVMYADTKSPSELQVSPEVFLKSRSFKEYPEHVRKIITDLYDGFPESQTNETGISVKITKAIQDIASSSPVEYVNVQTSTGDYVQIVTPEEKWLAVQFLKAMLQAPGSNYTKDQRDAYNDAIRTYDNDAYSDEDLQNILKELSELDDIDSKI